jgi:hypothetical protein
MDNRTSVSDADTSQCQIFLTTNAIARTALVFAENPHDRRQAQIRTSLLCPHYRSRLRG